MRRDRALANIAALAFIVHVAGCASAPPATPFPKAAADPTQRDEAKSAAKPADDAKVASDAIQRGDAAWQAQDLDRAIYYYVQAMDKTPNDAATLAKIGTIEDARGNVALAGRAFTLAHTADPEEPRIAERLGRLYLKTGNIDGASDIYTQVLSRDPQRTRSLDGMGEVFLARSDYAQAISYFDRALQAERPDSATVLTNRGYAKLRMNDLKGAESDLRAALAVAPRDDAWRYLGDVQTLRGDTAGAFESLLNAMDTAQAFNEIGVALMGIKKYQEARGYFTKAISASAAFFEAAQKNLALVDERLRNSSG